MSATLVGRGHIVLESSDRPLYEEFDLAMLDLDGVVYIGGAAVPGAPETLRTARTRMHLAFVTNNAARPPATVAEHLVVLGIEAATGDVVTSAQAAASVLREKFGSGARVATLGADGLEQALRAEGLVPVGADDDAVAATTGYGPDVVWRDIMRLAVRIRDGLPWVASNTDGSLPTPYGEAPGHGVLVEMVSRFAGVSPIVAGKPSPPLLEETMRRVGGDRPLMVGDRLDTDIEGGRNVGVPTLLVLTGVTGLPELAAAPPQQRPSFIAPDLAGLLETHPAPVWDGDGAELGGWRAHVVDQALRVEGRGEADDWWRAVAVACWRHLDTTGTPAATDGVAPPVPARPAPTR